MYSLSSEETRTQLKFLSSGNVIQRIKEDGLLSIKINKPRNKASEEAIILERKKSIFKDLKLENLINDIQKERFKKIRRISHDIGDFLGNMFPNIEMLVEDVKSKTDEEINIFFKNEKLNLLQNLKILHNDISSISDLNKLFRQDLDLVNKKHELKIYSAADIYKLTHKILKDVKSKTFVTVCELRMLDLLKGKIGISIDDSENNFGDDRNTKNHSYFKIQIKKYEYDKLGFKINEDLYKKFLNQFISNTKKHAGFIGENKKDNKLKVRFDFDGPTLNLVVMNNGQPFPKEWTKEQFVEYGKTTNTEQGLGSGGDTVNEIAKKFDISEWYMELNENDEFPVKFIFPLSLEPIE